MPLALMLLRFLGSGFVPVESLQGWMQGFAQWQPFTPFIEAIRSLLVGGPMGSSGVLAVAWAAVISVVGYAWAGALYERTSLN